MHDPLAAAVAKIEGGLRSVDHLIDDAMDDVIALQLNFAVGRICIAVRDDNDTLVISDGIARNPSMKRVDASGLWPWERAIGKGILWAWEMENQRGYRDAIQIEFANATSDEPCVVQFVAVASCIRFRQTSDLRGAQ